MIYKTINKYQFIGEFTNSLRKDNFTYDGLTILFNRLDEFDDDVEFDLIATCCDYSEDKLDSVLKNYSLESFEELQDETWAEMVDSETVIYQDY